MLATSKSVMLLHSKNQFSAGGVLCALYRNMRIKTKKKTRDFIFFSSDFFKNPTFELTHSYNDAAFADSKKLFL